MPQFVRETVRGRKSAASEQTHRVPVPFDYGESPRAMRQRMSLKAVGRVDHHLAQALFKLRWSYFCGRCGLAPKKRMVEFICDTLRAGKGRFRTESTSSPVDVTGKVLVRSSSERHCRLKVSLTTTLKLKAVASRGRRRSLKVLSCPLRIGGSPSAGAVTARCLAAPCVPWAGRRHYARWCLLFFSATRRLCAQHSRPTRCPMACRVSRCTPGVSGVVRRQHERCARSWRRQKSLRLLDVR